MRAKKFSDNFVKLLLLIVSISTSAYANVVETKDGAKIEFKGLFHVQSGFRIQGQLNKGEKNISSHNSKVALFTEAAIGADISSIVDNLTYGVNLHLMPTAQLVTHPNYTGSHIYVISNYGKVELGSPYDAGTKMRIEGGDVAAGSGDWGRFVNLTPNHIKYNDLTPEFAPGSENFFNSAKNYLNKGRHNDNSEPARMISFFTPEVEGVQVGVSFIPDSTNTGAASHNIHSTQISKVKFEDGRKLKFNTIIKNGFAGGISYIYHIDDGIDLKVAATGEYGKSAGHVTEIVKVDNKKAEINKSKLTDLRTYNVGATLIYGNFLYGASYGNLNKSLTSKIYNKTSKKVEYYNGSIAYGIGPSKTSISYFKSFKYKNTLDAVTVGTEYKTSGLEPYAELTYFKAGGKSSYFNNAPKRKVKGTIALLGLKLKI